jgi:ADP-ribosylglycohydrolase
VKKAINLYEIYSDDFRKAREVLINEYWSNIKEELISKEPISEKERVRALKEKISEVHVLPNIGIIVLSLLYGAEEKEDPFGRSICIAGMMGYDTDCNCGNIGAILGAQYGADNIPPKWKDPLQNTFSTYVKGHEKWKITELTRRVVNVGERVIKKKCSNVIIQI